MGEKTFMPKTEKFLPLLLYKLKRVAQIGAVVFVLWLFFFFYYPQVNVFGFTMTNPFFDFFASLPFWLYLIVSFIIVSFAGFIGFVVLSAFFNFRNSAIERKYEKFKRLFTARITDHLFQGENNVTGQVEEIRGKLKPYLKTNLQAEVYFHVITGIQEIVAMDLSNKFVQLNGALSIDRKVVRFLYSSRFDRRILALKVISYLRIKDFNATIAEYASSKNYALRTEAIAALIRLSEIDHLSYLLDQRIKLSLLEINVIVNAVIRNFKMDIDYAALLTSPNPRLATIGVAIARSRQRADLLPHIEALRGSDYSLLRKEAWKTFIALKGKEECIPVVIREFKDQNQKTQITILKSMQECRNEVFFDFMEQVARENPMPIKLMAMKILFNNSFERLTPFLRQSDIETHKAFLETVDFNIY
ncbi:MAG: hypothetical protein R6U46_07545 [Marinilabilia sp.]